MGDAGRGEMETAEVDKALREMMQAANALPIPDHLLKFVEELEARGLPSAEGRNSI